MIIPGQSLTDEPKNAPWEHPPQMSKPEEALEFHLDRLTEQDRFEAVLDLLELDYNVVELTEGILRGAVMDGRHSVDVSLIIAPIVHEFIKNGADKAGIDYQEFPETDDEERKEAVRYQINVNKARKLLEEYEEGDLGSEDFSDEEPTTMTNDDDQQEEEKEKPKGLMARMSKLEGDM